MLSSKKIEAMIFDLDGTLVKLPSIWKFFDELLVVALKEFNIPIPAETERLAIWHTGGNFEREIRKWGVKDYAAFIDRFDELDYNKRVELIEKGEICLFEDVHVLKQLAQNFKLGLLTNTPPKIALLELEAFGLKAYFDDLIMLGTVEQHIAKPEPAGFLRALRNLGAKPEQAAIVGDSSSDIIGGNRVGMFTILITRPGQPIPKKLQPPPDLTITKLDELLQIPL